MKYLLFILLPLVFGCHKKDTILPSTPAKDTVAIFKIWGSVPNTVNLTFTQGAKNWTKSINYNQSYTVDQPLEVILPVPGIKPVGSFEFKIQSTSTAICSGLNVTFIDTGNRVRVESVCGGIVD
jgi:hypothetical protein